MGGRKRKERCNAACRRRRRLRRWEKNVVHGLILAAIVLSLRYEGAKLADWLFVGLSLLTEVSA